MPRQTVRLAASAGHAPHRRHLKMSCCTFLLLEKVSSEDLFTVRVGIPSRFFLLECDGLPPLCIGGSLLPLLAYDSFDDTDGGKPPHSKKPSSKRKQAAQDGGWEGSAPSGVESAGQAARQRDADRGGR